MRAWTRSLVGDPEGAKHGTLKYIAYSYKLKLEASIFDCRPSSSEAGQLKCLERERDVRYAPVYGNV